VEGGRLQLQLEEPGRLLLLPVQPDSICPVKVVERGGGRSPRNTILALVTLVPHSHGSLLRRSPGASPQSRLVESPLGESHPLMWNNSIRLITWRVSYPLVVNLLKGIYNQSPSAPRYVNTWNPDTVLSLFYVYAAADLSILELSRKCFTLIVLCTHPIMGEISSILLTSISFSDS
jgi:hypothetical protein